MRHQGPIAGIAATADFVATAGYDNKVILWNAHSRCALAIGSHDHLINHCAFNANGDKLITASSDYSARIWSVPSLQLQTVLTGHQDDVDMALFAPNDALIATCALDRCVRIFDGHGHLNHVLRGHTGNVISLAWSPDSHRIISSSVDGTIRTWDSLNGKELSCIELQMRSDCVLTVDDNTIIAGDDLGRIAIVADNTLHFFQAHRAGIKKIVLGSDKRQLIALSYDGTMSVWHREKSFDFHEVSRATLPSIVWARAAAVVNNTQIATGTFGGSYALYDSSTHTWDLSDASASKAINSVIDSKGQLCTVGDAGVVELNGKAISSLGSLCNFVIDIDGSLFAGGQLGSLFNVASGVSDYRHYSPLNCAVSLDDESLSWFAVGTYTGEILIFEISAGGEAELRHTIKAFSNAVKGLAVDGSALCAVCASTDIAWYRMSDWRLQRRVDRGHDRIANACCGIGGGFASVSRDRNLRIWRDNSVEVYPSPHPNSVKCIAIDDKKRTLLTGSYGGTLAAFDLETRRWSEFRRPTNAGISSITWHSMHGHFVAASYDGNLYPVAI